MPMISWGTTKYFPGGHGTFIGWINSMVHVVMYTYYFLSAFGPEVKKYLWWKKYITNMQMVGIIFPNLSWVFIKSSFCFSLCLKIRFNFVWCSCTKHSCCTPNATTPVGQCASPCRMLYSSLFFLKTFTKKPTRNKWQTKKQRNSLSKTTTTTVKSQTKTVYQWTRRRPSRFYINFCTVQRNDLQNKSDLVADSKTVDILKDARIFHPNLALY